MAKKMSSAESASAAAQPRNENDNWRKILILLIFLLMSFGCIFCSSQAALWVIDRGQIEARTATVKYADYTLGPLILVPQVDAVAIAAEREKDDAALTETEPVISSVLAPVPLPPRPTARPTEPTTIALVTPTPTPTPTSNPGASNPPTPLPPSPPAPPPTSLPPTIPPTDLPQPEPTSALPATAPATQEPTVAPVTSVPTPEEPTVAPETSVPTPIEPTPAQTLVPTDGPTSTSIPGTSIPTTSPPTSIPPTATSLPPMIQFSSANYSVNESGGSATITVVLDKSSSQIVTVDYATGDGTATVGGGDYTGVTGLQLTFNPGETSKTFAVAITNDQSDEPDQTLSLILSNPTNASLGSPNPATLTILDNDQPPQVRFSNAPYSVNESNGPAIITVMLTNASSFPITVNYAASDVTATAGSDYNIAPGVLTFNPGETSKTFAVAITPDQSDEPDETLSLILSNPTNASLGSPDSATLTILDDDLPPAVQFDRADYSVNESNGSALITVTLTNSSAFTVTVSFTSSNGTAEAGKDYNVVTGILTFTPGQTSQSFSVTINDDSLDEPDEMLSLTLSDPDNASLGSPNPATLTILDDDQQPAVQFASSDYNATEGDFATITVTLTAPAPVTATVVYSTKNGTANNLDYVAQTGTLTFAPGETEQTFSVAILDDSDNELTETVLLSLRSPTNATLGAPSTATLMIEDDDRSEINFSPSDYSITEADATVTFTVTLSSPAPTTVTVDYSTNEWTASAGRDYVDTSGTLTFSPGQTSLTFTVTISDDDSREPNQETVRLNLTNPGGEADLGTTTTATLTISDPGGDSTFCLRDGTATETALEIGAPDGEFASVECDSALVVDLNTTPITTDGDLLGFDFVYYELEEFPPNIRLTWSTVKVAQDESGPWYQVFYWGDAITDTNTNIGRAGYGLGSSPPAGIESNPEDNISTTDLFGTAPYTTGIAIDIDAIVTSPSGPYRYVRFEALPGSSVNRNAQVDAVENLP